MDIMAIVKTHHKKMLAFFLCGATVPIGHAFTISVFDASLVWPSIGFVFAFLMVFHKKSIAYSVFLGLLVGYLFSHGLIQPTSGWMVPAQSLFSAAITSVVVWYGAWFLLKMNVNWRITFRDTTLFFAVFIAISFTAAILSNLTLLMLGVLEIDAFWGSALIWAGGDFFGLLYFGIPFSLALHLDGEEYTKRSLREEVFFYFILLLFTLLFFNRQIPFVGYGTHKFLFFPLAVIAAFYFPYRSLVIGSLIFLSVMVFFPPFLGEASYFEYFLEVNVFLTVITFVFLSIRYSLFTLNLEQEDLKQRRTRLEQLVDSTESLFSFAETVTVKDPDATDAVASKIFRMIYRLFNRIDYGSCMMVKEDRIHYIDAVGHDLEFLNSKAFNVSEWKANLDKPERLTNMEQRLKESLGEHYESYRKHNPSIKESVMMSVKIGPELVCEMSFDIREGSDDTFDEHILDYLQTLNMLMNSFFEAEVSIQKHNRMKRSMVSSLLTTIGMFDETIRFHSEDVAYIASELATALKFDRETVNKLYWAGITHDIGKIGVSRDVVRKEGQYSVDEYEQMKRHAELGSNLLKKSRALSDIAFYVKSHHERYDGQGYPEGLKGDEIPVEACVLALAEAIAAMGRKQPYSPAKTPPQIINELYQEKGSQFEPKCADAAIRLIEEGIIDYLYEE